ncbi:MAG: efflux RND transporter periplasmic adaptor subunit [Ignavibacteriales bacterium]|nr:efflux RND transporter periplasmic adaptor subunit [Ignavibacteriales bacterium]
MDNKNTDLSFLKIDRNAPRVDDGGGKKKIILFSSVGAVLVIAVVAIFTFNSASSAEYVELGTVALTTPAQENAVLAASGYIVAQRKAAVASKGTGRLEYLGVIEGDRVKTGQIIGRLESSDVEASLGQAKANLSVARAGLEQALAEREDATANFGRQTTLFAQNSISRAEYDGANARYKRAIAGVSSAEASIKFAEANVRSAEVQLEYTLIRAPFDGVVLTKNANVGEVISPFGAAAGSRGAIVTVADMTSLEVEADVSESNIEKIKEGQPCEITLDAYPEQRYPGFVNKIVPTADRAKATVLTKVRFSQLDERVLPEMRAKVNFLSDAKKQETKNSEPKISVPASAVTTRDGQKIVFVVKGDIVEEKAVTLGEIMGSRIEVKQGLSSGEKVVLRPAETLKTGTKITTEK